MVSTECILLLHHCKSNHYKSDTICMYYIYIYTHTYIYMYACARTYIYTHICINICACMCAKSLQSYLTLCDPEDWGLPGSILHGFLQARITEVGSHSRLQRIFPTQGSNPGLLHCRQILDGLSHQGSPYLKYCTIRPGCYGKYQGDSPECIYS